MSTINLVGPGAIGGALAGGLIEAGHEPTLIVRTPFDRLRVEWPDGSLDVPARCVTNTADIEPADIVIVATKATQNADVSAMVEAAVRPDSIVLIAQNGIDHLSRFDVDAHVVPAIVMLPSSRRGPGDIVLGAPSRLVIPASSSASSVESLFAASFIDVDVSDDWTSAAWHKLIMNAAIGGVGVLTRRGSEVFGDIEAQQLLLALMEEVASVGRAEGAVLADDLPANLQRYFVQRAGGHTTSIVVDRLAGVPTEWRERNQIVVDRAAAHGIDVPFNRVVTTLMRLGEPQ